MSIGGKREAWLTVASGRKGVGKSYTTSKFLEEYVSVLKRKCIILDTNGEYLNYRPIQCTEKNIKIFSMQNHPEIVRVPPYKKGGSKTLEETKQDMRVILQEFHGGLVLIEDVSRLVGDALDKELVGQICVLRHKNCDLILHYQGIMKSGQPKILMNTNILRLHWCDDEVSRYPGRFAEKEEILMIAENVIKNRVDIGLKLIRELEIKHADFKTNKIVQKQIDDIWNNYLRRYVFVNYDRQNISGKFTEQEFKDAIFSYISRNQKMVLNPVMDSINRDGTSIFRNKKDAINMIETQLFNKYYGN